MSNELHMIQMLERVARLVEQGQNDMAVATLDKMIYDLVKIIDGFEAAHSG
jgi:hypothetical protein